jgi:6-phospho-beta-glucosidase
VKIAVLGGAGVRTPLLVNGLVRSDLPVTEIGLFDIDRARLSVIAPLAAAAGAPARPYADPVACVRGASFVILSIRVGGIESRANDETIALEHGTVAQETVGAGGFAMAMRTIPHAVEYARLAAREAPQAWVVSFTNPVGSVTQAMTSATGARVIGICDTPTELFEDVAHVLELDSARCRFDYFGLNHLGWLREVYCDGTPHIERLWNEPTLLDRVYRAPLFERERLLELRLLPTEYLFYYYRPDTAVANTKQAGRTRGRAIADLNDQLFRDLAAPGADRTGIYDQYLAARNAGYMQIESGATTPMTRSPWAELTGYDKIALNVIRAIHFNTNAIIPLNVPNRSALSDLEPDDSVEVPCVVNANGAHPLTVGAAPDAVRDLLVRVKEYERATVRAATTRSTSDAVDALASNPLIRDAALARRLVSALQASW